MCCCSPSSMRRHAEARGSVKGRAWGRSRSRELQTCRASANDMAAVRATLAARGGGRDGVPLMGIHVRDVPAGRRRCLYLPKGEP